MRIVRKKSLNTKPQIRKQRREKKIKNQNHIHRWDHGIEMKNERNGFHLSMKKARGVVKAAAKR